MVVEAMVVIEVAAISMELDAVMHTTTGTIAAASTSIITGIITEHYNQKAIKLQEPLYKCIGRDPLECGFWYI